MFESFKTPENVTVPIEGQNFILALPTRWNRAYTRSWQEAMAKDAKQDESTGTVTIDRVSVSALQEAQLNAFVRHCIIKSPVKAELLLTEYIPLLDILFKIAESKAEELEEHADDLVKKSLASSAGITNGEEKLPSTESSNLKAA